MQIQLDSREKARAIKKIIATFDKKDVKYFTSKCYVGDYVSLDNPRMHRPQTELIRTIQQPMPRPRTIHIRTETGKRSRNRADYLNRAWSRS